MKKERLEIEKQRMAIIEKCLRSLCKKCSKTFTLFCDCNSCLTGKIREKTQDFASYIEYDLKEKKETA